MAIVAVIFVLTLLGGVPMAFVLGLTGIAHLFTIGEPAYMSIITQRLFTGVNNFSLMCIPFFVLAGDLMNKGGVTKRLLNFARELVGWIPGGMAYCCVILAMVLSAILGSANAVAAILCAILIGEMAKDGYDADFTGSIIAASSVLGPIIPPSVTFIIYGVLTGVSVSRMFMAGIVPGIMLGISYALIITYYTKKRGYKKSKPRFDPKACGIAFVNAVAVVAAVVAAIIYRSFDIKSLPEVLLNTGMTTAAIMLIVAFGNIIGWSLAIENIPTLITETILSITDSQIVVMLLIIACLFVIGCLMDAFAAMYVFTPVFYPLAMAVGLDPIHFGIIFCLMLTIGLCTPPVGMLLFVTSNISKVPLAKLSKSIWPFVAAAMVVVLLMTFFPQIVMFIPNWLSPA